jgi:hypothetical protein
LGIVCPPWHSPHGLEYVHRFRLPIVPNLKREETSPPPMVPDAKLEYFLTRSKAMDTAKEDAPP